MQVSHSSTESASAGSSVPGNPFQRINLVLDWSRQDIERRFGFHGGRFTNPGTTLPLLVSLVVTAAFFALLILIHQRWPELNALTALFLERGPCPYATMFFFFWALFLLFFKWRKFAMQTKALNLPIMPQEPDFELTPTTAKSVRERMSSMVDNPHHFLLLNRIDLALANLHNIGHTADVAAILKIQSENDESQVASSYGLIQGFMWAIPVLGFIGTVLGLSEAIGAFAGTLQAGGEIDAIRSSLQQVTSGLATAFETTLLALLCALILQFLVSFLQSRESEFLDTCNDICHRNVAGKLRLNAN